MRIQKSLLFNRAFNITIRLPDIAATLVGRNEKERCNLCVDQFEASTSPSGNSTDILTFEDCFVQLPHPSAVFYRQSNFL